MITQSIKRSRKMATVASLIPELLSEVFSCFSGLYPSGSLRYQLCSFSLVCRAWREPAQHALFGNLDLCAMSAEAWLQSPARTRYHVKGLSYSCEEHSDPSTFVKVQAACAGLSSLILKGKLPDGGYSWLGGQEASSKSVRKQIKLSIPDILNRPAELDCVLATFDSILRRRAAAAPAAT